MNIKTSRVEFASYSSNEWIVDFETGDNGQPKSNLDAVAQDIRFALETDRYKWPIMGSNFGASFDDLIGTDYNYIRSEVVRRIRDALSIDDRILQVDEFQFTPLDDSGILISCTVSTTFGNVSLSRTIQP
jgi:hypothetical protein